MDVSIPKDAEVIGSLVYSANKYEQVEIILDVPMKPNEVFVFYRDSLKNAGLNESEYFHRPHGCIPFFDSEGVTFY